MEKYYKILGVTAHSTHDEIRRNYRKLVMRYHPDKNPSKQDAHHFLLIKEAYEIVTGKITPPVAKPRPNTVKKAAQNNSSTPRTVQRKKTSEADRLKAARDRFKEQILREEIENERYFRRLSSGKRWKLMKLTAAVGLIVSISAIADRFLPRHYVEDRVTNYVLNKASSFDGKALSFVKTSSGRYFWVSDINYLLYSKAPTIYVERTWLFHEPVHLIARDKVKYEYFPVHFTHYRHFVLPILFLIPAFVIWYKRKTITFTVLFLSSYYGVSALLIYFLLAGDRWAHLLTLGFL